MSSVQEKVFFFSGSKKRSLLGVLHQPISPGPSAGIVYCHPFAEEKNMSHAVAVRTARAFAENGFATLRFDFSGCGDSEGDLDQVTLDDWQEDLHEAINVLKRESGVKYFGLWGLRLGAGLAILHESKTEPASFAILWEPVFRFSTYIHQFLRLAISSQITRSHRTITVSELVSQIEGNRSVSITGYPVNKKLYDSFINEKKQPFQLVPNCPTLLLSISMAERPGLEIQQYFKLMNSNGNSGALLHVKAEPFWDRYWRWECPEVVQPTLQWLAENR